MTKKHSTVDPKEEGETLTTEQIRTEEPPLYRVLLLNDDYTTMEFVVVVLQTVFNKGVDEAAAIMLAVLEKGVGTAGIYTKEIAETKIALVHQFARENGHPLKCIMEPT